MWSVGLLIGLIGGAGATLVAQRFFIKSKSQEIIKNAEIEAENIRKERALQSKEKFLKQKEEHEESIREREKRMPVAQRDHPQALPTGYHLPNQALPHVGAGHARRVHDQGQPGQAPSEGLGLLLQDREEVLPHGRRRARTHVRPPRSRRTE